MTGNALNTQNGAFQMIRKAVTAFNSQNNKKENNMDKLAQLISLLALLATGGCGIVETGVAVTPVVYKGSQALNELTGGKAGETITEDTYQRCNRGDKSACFLDGVFSITFFPADTFWSVILGKPELIGSGHGKTWNNLADRIPTITKIRKNYGGAKYNSFIQKKR